MPSITTSVMTSVIVSLYLRFRVDTIRNGSSKYYQSFPKVSFTTNDKIIIRDSFVF